MRILGRFSSSASMATLGAIIAFALGEPTGLVLEVWLIVLGALVLQALVRGISASSQPERSTFEAALQRRQREPDRPEELVRTEQQTELASITQGDAYFLLRPKLRSTVRELCRLEYGFDPDDRPERAADVLGAEVWEFLRPGTALAANRHARGPTADEIERIVVAIERIR